jgi:hypothetical protein
MKIKELITELQKIEDQEREIVIVRGNEDETISYSTFNIHGADTDTALELYVNTLNTTSLARHDKAVADGTTIVSVWSVEDVYGLATDPDYPITEDDAKSVLWSVKKNFDANVGVNWEVLQYYLDDLDLTPVSKLKAKTFHTN